MTFIKFSRLNLETKEFENNERLFPFSSVKTYEDLTNMFLLSFDNVSCDSSSLVIFEMLFHNKDGAQNIETEEDIQELILINNTEHSYWIQVNFVLTTIKSTQSDNNINYSIKNKDLLLRRLIKHSSRSYFELFYSKYYECLICKDILFDPVQCNKCNEIFCRSCIYSLSTNSRYTNSNFRVLNCFHRQLNEIEKSNRYEYVKQLEKVKLDCYYKCGNADLNLLNYAKHIRICNENDI